MIDMGSMDVLFSHSGSDLILSVNGTDDTLLVRNWYSGKNNQTEEFVTSDNRHILNTRVDQLIQAMAVFSANNGGMSWNQAIHDRPQDVQQVLVQYWTPQQ